MVGARRGQLLRLVVVSLCLAALVLPEHARMQDIQAQTQVSAPRIAPGESMPVQVKLSNFGSTARADVVITYTVISSGGTTVLRENETYAVETTASFIHTLALPDTIQPGQYSIQVSIAYAGQKTPAIASYPFTVERKIAGVFVSDLISYGLIAFAGIAAASAFVWLIPRRRRSLPAEDYSDIPRTVRIYYEIIGDAIRAMRIHEGDEALTMAARIPGLTINKDTGRVTHLTGEPASIVAALLRDYEKHFGKHVNLAFGKDMKERATVR